MGGFPDDLDLVAPHEELLLHGLDRDGLLRLVTDDARDDAAVGEDNYGKGKLFGDRAAGVEQVEQEIVEIATVRTGDVRTDGASFTVQPMATRARFLVLQTAVGYIGSSQ